MQSNDIKYIKGIKFNITQEQIDTLKPLMPNLSELLKGDYSTFEEELDIRISYYLDEEYEHTKESRILETMYDEIYQQN